MQKNKLEVLALDWQNQPLKEVSLKAIPETAGTSLNARYDNKRELYIFDDLRPGFFKLQIDCAGYDSQTRRVQVHPKSSQVIFMLGRSGGAYSFRGCVCVPYQSEPELIGIIPSAKGVDESTNNQSLRDFLTELNLNPQEEVSNSDNELKSRGVDSPAIPGACIVRCGKGPLKLSGDEDLKALRESPLIEAAGPLFRKSEKGFSVFTHRLFVKFLPGVSRKELGTLLEGIGLKFIKAMGYSPNLFLVESDIGIGEEINKIASQLNQMDQVEYAEPVTAESPEIDTINPSDYLWQGLWDRQLSGIPEAWQRLNDVQTPEKKYGDPNVIIAVVDQGIQSSGGVPLNPDFQGSVSDGRSKVYKLHDFRKMVPDNDTPLGDHGVACAGIATGKADNPSIDPSLGEGIAGASPNARLIGLIYASHEAQRIEMYLWAAGLDAQSDRIDFPDRISPGADIFSTSIGFGAGFPLSQSVSEMLDFLARRGRGGKGCMAFFSAGNDPSLNIQTNRPYGWHDMAFSCAASSLDDDGSEIRASYSGFGLVEWCAPSHDEFVSGGAVHNPPKNYATWTTDFYNRGNMPSVPLFETTLNIALSVGENKLILAETTGLESLTYLLLGDPGAADSELVFFENISDPINNEISIRSPVIKDHPIGKKVTAGSRLVSTLKASAAISDTEIFVNDVSEFSSNMRIVVGYPNRRNDQVTITGDPDPATGRIPITALGRDWDSGIGVHFSHYHHRNDFGGTSSATPLCAGIAALVISAQPDLTWIEVREILRNTAVKFDLDNNDPVGQWLDANGDPSRISGLSAVRSPWYGHGRLDADKAVEMALNYDFPRDLMIRSTLADNGETPTVSSADSPDVWVRAIDPALDIDALPLDYNTAGPHQNPRFEDTLWIYARIKNRGTLTSLDAWANFYIASFDGTPFDYPNDWEPKNGIGNASPNTWERGAYFIGEVALPNIAPDEDIIINIPWPEELVPPPYTPIGDFWTPHILVEIFPHDGPLKGSQVGTNNNLAQKAVIFVDDLPPLVEYLDTDENLLETYYPIPSTVLQEFIQFEIRISDLSFFNSESVTFEVTWFGRDGSNTTVNFVSDAGQWVLDSPSPSIMAVGFAFNDDGDVVSGNVPVAIWKPSLQVKPEFEKIEIKTNVRDLTGNPTPVVEAVHVFNIAIPTDIALVLDYSGSMRAQDSSGQSKWESAKEAANLFNTLYAALSLPELDDRISLVRFFADGASGPDFTEVTETLRDTDASIQIVNVPEPPTGQSLYTPIGSGLVVAHGELQGGAWRSRIMIILTDGRENRDPTLVGVRSALVGSSNFVPNQNDDIAGGYRIHACAFGLPEQVDTAALQDLVMGGDGLKSYNGQLHSTETTAEIDQAFALKEKFISLLVDALPVEMIGPFGNVFDVEPGIREMVIVVTGQENFSVTPPDDHIDPIDPVNVRPDFSWVRISNPEPGMWIVGDYLPSDTVKGYAVVDLVLQASFDAGRQNIGVGRSVPLWAEITENGIPVSGAIVVVSVEKVEESIGQILTKYVQSKSFLAKDWRDRWNKEKNQNPTNIRADLLKLALEDRGFGLKLRAETVLLHETSTPGRYEGFWVNTQEEGTYTFRFKATGKTWSGNDFQRNYVLSRHLEPVPASELTTFTWTSFPLLEKKVVLWKGTLNANTATNRPLGPGFQDKIKFLYAGPTAKMADSNPLKTVDNLDGTYGVELELPIGRVPSPLKLAFGNRQVSLFQSPTPCRRVRIILRRIQALDDKETWFPSPGEMVFDAAIAPNSDPERLVRKRVPSEGYIRLADGESQEMNLTVFDGFIEEGGNLDFSIGGTEFDWFLFFTKKDSMARYRRKFSGNIVSWAGEYCPDDEPDDPESLHDWRLWYSIEVI